MELRTKINITPSPRKITYNDRVMFIGSCFASSIGSRLEMGKIPVMINPSGTVYNPVSVCNTLDTITSGRELSQSDLYNYKGTWLSFNHYTDFSSDDPLFVLEKINSRSRTALSFLENAGFLFITLGTARVFRLKETGQIVSNCHKIPASYFEPEILTVDEIVALWTGQLEKLQRLFPNLKVIFTISPVRHWKDGAHGNQVSKSVLFLAVEKLLGHPSSPAYFPAYEIVMDELRDYRFYSDDMLHPSSLAIDYIWEYFSGSYLDKYTLDLYNEVLKIRKATTHRISKNSDTGIKDFVSGMQKKISDIESKAPELDFSVEKKYFQDLLGI
ncbi:MAG: GSCFA domain-containing protein [Bacteroidales bacterium]|nr:GSCFA domain-containing protein [Bacteroidales bacterium]